MTSPGDVFSWVRAREGLIGAARSLAREEIESLAELLAPEVIVVLPPAPPIAMSRSQALGELVRWRRQWSACDVSVGELLRSGALFAATARLTVVVRDGAPRWIDLGLIWSIGVDGLRRIEVRAGAELMHAIGPHT